MQLHVFLRGVHRADADSRPAAFQPAGLLAKRGDLDEPRTRVDVGDRFAASELADLLAGHGDLDQAVQIERALADAGEGNAQRQAKLLTQQQVGHCYASTTALYTSVSSDFRNRTLRAALDKSIQAALGKGCRMTVRQTSSAGAEPDARSHAVTGR